MTQTNDNNNQEDRDPATEEQVDRLIERLEKECSSVETMEIIHGLTPEEIEEKGFTGAGNHPLQRSKYAAERSSTGLQFCEGMHVFHDKGIHDPAEITPEEMKHLPAVHPGRIVAFQKLDLQKNPRAFEEYAARFGPEYLTKANMELRPVPDGAQFVAASAGNVAFIDNRLFVIPADRDGLFAITVSDDRMRVYATVTPHSGAGKPADYAMAKDRLRELGVVAGIREAELSRALEKVGAERQSLRDIVIAEGKQPVTGADATAELFFSTGETYEDFRIMPDGRVDYHRKASIPIVHKGDLLARAGTPGRGVAGFDVFGAVLPAGDGQPCRLIAGENVRTSEDGNEFFADADGQVTRIGDVLGVFEHYLVDGDVDFGTGNIDFNGNVTVRGMVLAGFEVKASGDITVIKGIESATVLAGRDLKVGGGIFGVCVNGTIACGRDLYAHHLQNTAVEVQGDVYIENSCIQSSILCNGKVLLRRQKGAIIGGMVSAMAGVEAKTIGSVAGTRTEICAGSDYLVKKTMAELNTVLEFYRRNLVKIDQALAPLLQQLEKGVSLTTQKKSTLAQVMEKRKHMKKQIAIMESNLKNLERKAMADPTATIKASEKICSGVAVRIAGSIKTLETAVDRCTMRLDEKSGAIESRPY